MSSRNCPTWCSGSARVTSIRETYFSLIENDFENDSDRQLPLTSLGKSVQSETKVTAAILLKWAKLKQQ